jgi:hypothetical protein
MHLLAIFLFFQLANAKASQHITTNKIPDAIQNHETVLGEHHNQKA